jgi:two-component system chemotaxis response regulator CheY
VRVLAVDDSSAILDLITEILTAKGFEVETADNGAAALDKYARFKPDIVTLDLAMPIMDGYDTLKRLLAFDKNANVIMLTANEQQRVLENCIEKGAIGYITKPFSSEHLVSMIDIALKAGSDKNAATMFSLVCNKVQNVMKALLPTQTVSVILSQVVVVRQQALTEVLSPSRDLAQIRVVPNLVRELHIEAPRNTIGFVTEFGGQQSGTVVSFGEIRAIMEAMGMPKNMAENDAITARLTEFFNIFNSKIISELGNSAGLILTIEPTKTFNRAEYDGASPGKEVTKAKFDIVVDQKKSSIESQLWFNTMHIFRERL